VQRERNVAAYSGDRNNEDDEGFGAEGFHHSFLSIKVLLIEVCSRQR
jgi:hypothetical protein